MVDRRQILIGTAGLVAAAVPSGSVTAATLASSQPSAKDYIYDYLFVELSPAERGASQKAFLSSLTQVAAAVRAAHGEALGYFTPLIGWSSQHLVVLLRWKGETSGRDRVVGAIESHPSVRKVDRSKLAATTRPGPSDLPLTTGIYTHRWFDVKTTDVAEFVDLSNRAWPAFEREFASRIYGLFRAEQTADDAGRGLTRMLLNTQYDSHAVWEASRRPSSEPANLFERRGELTVTTRVASLRFHSLT